MSDLVVHEEKPRQLGRRVAEALAGSAIAFIGWSLVGSSVMKWWYAPPTPTAFSCGDSVKAAIGQFVFLEMVSAVVGALVVSLVLYFLRRWWSKRRGEGRAATPPAASSS